MVEYGISNCYYYCNDYAAPFQIEGAVSLTIDDDVEIITSKHFGSNFAYASRNHGYTIQFKTYYLPYQFLQDVLGYVLDKNGIIADNNIKPSISNRFTLLFETKSESKPIRHKIINCYCAKLNYDVTTVSDTTSITPYTITIYTDFGVCGQKSSLHYQTTSKTLDEVYNNWFITV